MSEADSSSIKKVKDRIQQLSELRRGLVHYTDAQYGTANDPAFVMRVTVDGMDFQGIGPSKKRAKVMASECALAYLGVIDAGDIQLPESETPDIDDHTADAFGGLLYSNFETPDVSANDASLKLPVYKPEGVDSYEEYDTFTMQDAFQGYVGCNAVSILSEMRPDAHFELLCSLHNTNPTRFVTAVRVRGRSYCGDARSKKLSKARAAAVALTDIYGIEFGTAEDGMPVYEGATKFWENYKAQVEKEAETEIIPVNVVNPVEQLNELFPEAEFEHPDAKFGGFFRAQFTISGTTYEGLGLNKRDAKANAAANAIEGLEKSGLLEERKSQLKSKRKDREEKQKPAESDSGGKAKQVQEYTNTAVLSRNPTAKLQQLYPNAVHQMLGETPLRNTAIRAFVAAVTISDETTGDQTFVGVGRSKKLAKATASEKCLRALGQWTEEDELAKWDRQIADTSEASSLLGEGGFGLQASGIHPMFGSLHAGQFGKPQRGPMGWNVGLGSRGFLPRSRARGRAFGAGYGWQEGYGGVMDDEFYSDTDAMVGELSNLVGQILSRNPNMGVSDVWGMLQQNADYQSWRTGSLGTNAYGLTQNYGDSFAADYYGYPGAEYYQRPGAYRAGMRKPRARGTNVQSLFGNTATRGRRGNLFQNTASYW